MAKNWLNDWQYTYLTKISLLLERDGVIPCTAKIWKLLYLLIYLLAISG